MTDSHGGHDAHGDEGHHDDVHGDERLQIVRDPRLRAPRAALPHLPQPRTFQRVNNAPHSINAPKKCSLALFVTPLLLILNHAINDYLSICRLLSLEALKVETPLRGSRCCP